MNHLLPDPPRWKDERAQANLAERSAGETLRSLPQAEPLTPVQLSRIAARIRVTRPRRLGRLVFLTLSLLVGVATAASAAHLDLLPTWLGGSRPKAVTSIPHDAPKVRAARKGRPVAAAFVPSANEPAPTAPLAPALPSPPVVATSPSAPVAGGSAASPRSLAGARKLAHRAAAPTPVLDAVDSERPAALPEPKGLGLPPTSLSQHEPVAPDLPAVEPAQALAVPASPLPAAPSAPTRPPAWAAPPPVPPRRTSEATKHFSETIHALRVQHDPKTALALLDRHAALLTQNALGHEALLLRVEALLDLGREGEVLRLLDGAALTDVAASHSLLITRGRLRAAANRCADGAGDFSLVLAESRKPDRHALFGRALCRKQLGDAAGARADLERYRREFPTDPRLGELERRLASPP